MTIPLQKTATVIGGAGGIGLQVAKALVRHGWRVRSLARRPQAPLDGIEWILGDALVAADVLAASAGADLIVHAVNPPGYKDWDKVVLPMLENTIAAAKANRARIILPGTVYNFGPDAFPELTEDAPQHPVTRKGAIRVEMERRLEQASGDGVRVLIVRAGDFFGNEVSGSSWFSQGLVQAGKPVTRTIEPQKSGTRHAWAYLPDVAEVMAQLADCERDLPDFDRYHFAGYVLKRGDMAAAIRRAAGRRTLPIHAFPWPVLVVLQPFVRLFKEMAEMRYLWRQTVILDGSKLAATLGKGLPATPLDDAVRETLRGLGCLPA